MDLKKRWRTICKDVDCVIIPRMEPVNDTTFYAVTGVENAMFNYGVAIVKKNSVHLLVSSMEEEEAKRTGIEYDLHGKNVLKKIISDSKTIGVDARKISWEWVQKLKKMNKKIIDVSALVNEALAVKTESEIRRMKKACSITASVAKEIPSLLQNGMSEKDLAADIEYRMRKLGADGVAFDTIVAFGAHSADPHHQTSNSRLKKGQFVLCDFGAQYKHLNADCTRTFIFGKATKDQKALYDLVLKVQKKCVMSLKKHKVHELMKYAVTEINKGIEEIGLKGSMMHSLGHGLGFDVHEDIRVNTHRAILPVGSVTTIEPGAYVPGFGGVRIEDDILITSKGIEVLTKAPYKV